LLESIKQKVGDLVVQFFGGAEMAQTTTAVNACDVVVSIDDDGGTLTDVSGSTNEVAISFEINMGEANTFDGNYPLRLVCGKTASMSLTALYTTTGDEAWDLIKGWLHVYDGDSRTVRVDCPDSTTGSDRYEGEWTLVSYDHTFSSGEGGPIMVSAELVNDGTINLYEIGT